MPETLLDTLELGPAQGGRQKPVDCEIVRPLQRSDIELLRDARLPAAGPSIARISHSHHQLARLIVRGLSNEEAAAISGYSPSYVSNIKHNDPAFRELVAYYSSNEELIHVDVNERMRALGLDSLEELQQRLAENPESWDNKRLMELAELMLVKPAAAKAQALGGAGGRPGGIQIGISFVSPQRGDRAEGAQIDVVADSITLESE